MKKLAFILMLLPFFANAEKAEEVFVTGTEWEIATYGYDQDYQWGETRTIEIIDGDTVVYGKKCLKLYSMKIDRSSKKIITVLRKEGERVYFLENTARENWLLLYDFGLKDGESCDTARPNYPWNEKTHSNTTTFTCISHWESDSFPGFEVMEMWIPDCFVTTYWLRGYCSENGMTTNGKGYSGGGGMLMKIRVGGQVIYDREALAGTDSPLSLLGIRISVSGRRIDISGLPWRIPVSIYDISGRMAFSVESSGRDISHTLSAPGIYVVTIGNVRKKILVR